MENLAIYVAAHKKVNEYNIDNCYKNLHVGAACHDYDYGYICDNTGDNISEKNPTYCELTGLYWMWKNAPKTKYIGLCHYRRYPSECSYSLKPETDILSGVKIMDMLLTVDVLLPQKLKKTEKNSLCKSVDELVHCREFIYISKAIKKQCPEYLTVLREVFMDTEMCFGNIFVMSRKNFDLYCEWLFSLLFDIEATIKNTDDETPREYGYLSEWLLNVWIIHNDLKIKYISTIFTEEKHDWKFYIKLIRERMGK